MRLIRIRIFSLFIICLLLLIPSFQALEKQAVKREYKNRFDSLITVKKFTEHSLLKKSGVSLNYSLALDFLFWLRNCFRYVFFPLF